MNISKLTFGTAQLGSNYGIANKYGKPSTNESIKMLTYAWENGISCFDTSPQYGSEKIIGTFISSKISSNDKKPVIISKLPKIPPMDNYKFEFLYNHIKEIINQSLTNLYVDCLPIFLLHHAPDIYIEEGLVIDCLSQIKKENLIDKFGISVYNTEEVEASLKYNEIDVIEIPINIFDQRLINTGLLKKLKEKGYIILARSIYLQGLFFLSLDELKKKSLKFDLEPLIELYKIRKRYNIDMDTLAFLFVRDLPEITSLVIGMENITQLVRNLNLFNAKPLKNEIREQVMTKFSELPEKLINPSLWEK